MRLKRVSADEPGLRRVRRGRGFEYLDVDGAHLDDEEQVARIRSLAIPPAWTDVWICAAPNGHMQATGADDAGRRQYLYHSAWRARADTEKYDRMLALAQSLPAARRGVTMDLRQEGTGRPAILAAAFRMLDAALLRVGSEEYAREHGSVGLSTLRCAHATMIGDVVSLHFPGKSGQPWESAIEDADLAALLGELKRTRGAAARLLAWQEDGEWHPLRAAEINEDVRERTGGEFTAKDFRTLHGTVIAASVLARIGVRDSGSARTRAMRRAVREVAAALGNTPAVARASYIDPRLLDLYERGIVVDVRSGRGVEGQLTDLLNG